MKPMKKLIPIFLLILTVAACGGDSFDAEAEKNKVLDVQDEVMPKIGEVMNLKKKVLKKADSMEDESADALRDLAQRLDDANSSMMTWMRDWSGSYSKIMESDDIEAQKAWFAEEMEKVQEVKEKINNSIEEAKKELE